MYYMVCVSLYSSFLLMMLRLLKGLDSYVAEEGLAEVVGVASP